MPIDRYSFETVEMLKIAPRSRSWRRELLIARARLAGKTQAEAEVGVPDLTLQAIDVSFDAIPDPKEREYFSTCRQRSCSARVCGPVKRDRRAPTAAVDDYQALVRELGGTPGITAAARRAACLEGRGYSVK